MKFLPKSRRDGFVRSPILIYPFNVTMALMFFLIGIGLIGSGFSIQVTKVQELPFVLVFAWAVFLVLSGPLIVAGLMWQGAPYTARAVERAGLYLAASAWSTYTIAILYYAPVSVVPIGQGITIALACILRAYALHRVDRMVAHIESVATFPERS